MKRRNNKVISLFAVAIIVMLGGVMLPGVFLHSNMNIMADQVTVVPQQYYTASNSAMAKNNSKRMKTSEKIQLITGTWESTIKEANKYDMDLKDYEAVALAQESLGKLYEAKLFPTGVDARYGNWYSWTAKSYKAIDSIFNTYTSYYWVIELAKYDGAEKHEIYMLEDGTILCCISRYDEEFYDKGVKNAYDVLIKNNMEVSMNDIKAKKIEDVIKYPADVNGVGNVQWIYSSDVKSEDEEYNIIQAKGDKTFFYQLTDIGAKSE